MDPVTALLAFSLAAALLTITPGLDTALVLRTAAVEGGRSAFGAGTGIAAGLLVWAAVTALGLGALLAVSETAYNLLRIAGVCYLFWLGGRMLWDAFAAPRGALDEALPASAPARQGWFLKGLMTNLLNPKVGVFYVTFLPQFIPAGGSVLGYSLLLALIHVAQTFVWFSVLIIATQPLSHWLRRPRVARALDGVTGSVLILFGLKLALERR